jgi:hypothetical protein
VPPLGRSRMVAAAIGRRVVVGGLGILMVIGVAAEVLVLRSRPAVERPTVAVRTEPSQSPRASSRSPASASAEPVADSVKPDPQELDRAPRFLEATYPHTYGGWLQISETNFVVLEVGRDPALEASAVAALPGLHLSFETVLIPLARLDSLASRIQTDLPTIEAAGISVFEFGPDERVNKVYIGLEKADASGVALAQTYFDAQYGAGLTHVVSLSEGPLPPIEQPIKRPWPSQP